MPTAYSPIAATYFKALFPTEIVMLVLVILIPTLLKGIGVEIPFLNEEITDAVVIHVDGIIVKRLGS